MTRLSVCFREIIMNQIRINKGIEIEVNDKGETITLATNDIDFLYKVNETAVEIEKIVKECTLKEKAIQKKTPSKEIGYLTDIDYELRKLYKKTFANMRKAMDGVLGDGACRKIFGDTNSLTMWDELIEQLAPILQEAGVFEKDIKAEIAEKYGDDSEDTLE